MKLETAVKGIFVGLIGAHAETGRIRSATHTPNNSRIVGGEDAEIGGYPFFVEWEGCGASLIHKGEFLFMQIMVLATLLTRF